MCTLVPLTSRPGKGTDSMEYTCWMVDSIITSYITERKTGVRCRQREIKRGPLQEEHTPKLALPRDGRVQTGKEMVERSVERPA